MILMVAAAGYIGLHTKHIKWYSCKNKVWQNGQLYNTIMTDLCENKT